MKTLVILASMIVGSTSFASVEQAHNGKKIICYADDNQSWELNAQRTTLKYTVEGESLGAKKTKRIDGKAFVSYTTSVGTLTLSARNTFQFAGETDKIAITCI